MRYLAVLVTLLLLCSCVHANPVYILKLKVYQSRISLNMWNHLKDAANACTFEFPTDETTYNSLKIGDNILEKTRLGSLIIKHSFSEWKITVINKRIQQ